MTGTAAVPAPRTPPRPVALRAAGPVPEVLLLAPSAGLGGGIERYVETLQWAFRARSVGCRRVDLARPGPAGHWQLLRQAGQAEPGEAGPVRVVAAHRALLPVALAVRRRRPVSGISVICHGSDVWGPAARPRWWLERRALRDDRVRVVSASAFTAGAVGVGCQSTVLTPGLARPWFDQLQAAGRAAAAAADRRPGGVRLATAFRLADWQDKGLPELLAAVASLDRPDVTLTVCGSGAVPPALDHLASDVPWCRLRAGLADADLARELAAADLFVLATRTRPGRRPAGEGFGLVLLEAQVTGTPVLAPARGGGHDAFVEDVTGVAPADESAGALARSLAGLLAEPGRLAGMGAAAADWAARRYDPDRYADRAVSRLL